ncbi:cytochrome P450 [Polyplosphaeria fusca]|uniref:Cytochrome P450 n=1 Tax=Polyplosphaeria fusca TaxID=682080 RepID=A0A9P4QTF3_9PLEO|nr:cytochrome P450 [Polyplosphaeria fusca]
MLLVAGYDTTTTILVYAYHLLSKHPEALEKLREEHNTIFGSDTSVAAARLREDSKVLNNLPYTQAVIKETMRIFPPVAALRAGSQSVELADLYGTRYPTGGCYVVNSHHSIHSNPHSHPDPDAFKPERWIDSGMERGAWRPFERGARSCIGQDVAMIQLKVALMCTIRTFKIEPVYEEWDAMKAKNAKLEVGKAYITSMGRQKDRKEQVGGERAYQVECGGAAHAKEGYPCRVTLLQQ